MKRNYVDPLFMFSPLIFTFLLIGGGLTWFGLNRATGLFKLLVVLLPTIKIATLIGLIGFTICFVSLVFKHNLVNYLCSIGPTFYVYESLRIYPKFSEYKNRVQRLSYAEREFNFCVRLSYIWKTKKVVKVVVSIPRNSEARSFLLKKLPEFRNDLVARFSEYSFGGKFEQYGGFMVLEGSG